MLVGSMAKSPWVDEDSIEAVSDSESPDGLNDAKIWWKQDFEDLGK